MNKNTLIAILSVLVVGLGIACVSLLSSDSMQRTSSADGELAKLEAENASLRKTVEELEEKLTLAELSKEGAELARESAEHEATKLEERFAEMNEAMDEEASDIKENSERMMRNISEMMENPTMNKMVEAQQRATIKVLYEDLIASLGLEGEEQDYLMDLLVSRQMGNVDLAMKLMSGQLSEEDKKELQQQLVDNQKAIGEEIDYFLNSEEDSDFFKFYEKTMGARIAISGLEQTLQKMEMPLADGQSEDLIRIMHDTKKDFDFTRNYDSDNYDLSPERFSDEAVTTHLSEMEAYDAEVANQVSGLLTPEQFEEFKKSQAQMRAMMQHQLEMAGQMFGDNKSKEKQNEN